MVKDRLNELSFTFLYFNLGGEMMYIINQRLNAQQTSPDKSHRVVDDILVSLLSLYGQHLSRFMQSNSRLSANYLKNTFETITSSSPIMRLTPSSFNKLFDLIIGVLKFQVVRSPFPSSLLHVTNNHFGSMRDLAADLETPTVNLVSRNYDMVQLTFKILTQAEWMSIRNYILSSVFMDMNIRISILLREGLQDMETGSFTIPGEDDEVAKSVRITHYDDEGDVLSESGEYTNKECLDDSTPLGLDIYCQETETCAKCEAAKEKELQRLKEEKLLANLLGRDGVKKGVDDAIALDFNFLEDEMMDQEEINETRKKKLEENENEEDAVQKLGSKVVLPDTFDTEIDGETKDDCDLLQLMDSC